MLKHMLSHLMPSGADEDLTDEELAELEAERKKERIQFHRDKVRNGPGKFSWVTTGQARRQVVRENATRNRKLNKRHRRAWMAQQADIATLRGHLIIMGVVECPGATEGFAPHIVQESAVWVARKYGKRDDEGKLVTGDTLVADAVAEARTAYLEFTGAQARR